LLAATAADSDAAGMLDAGVRCRFDFATVSAGGVGADDCDEEPEHAAAPTREGRMAKRPMVLAKE
jgi:hypothetical protein